MHLIEVIPITRARTPETLSYFHSTHLEKGALVKVPIRKKDVRALVVSSTDAKKLKANIRTSEYSLKKISSVEKSSFLTREFLGAAEETSKFFLTPLTKVLFEIIPTEALELGSNARARTNRQSVIQEYVEGGFEKRTKTYKDAIEKCVHKGFSSLVLCPTSEDARKVHKALAQHVLLNPILFHGKLPKKKKQEFWEDLQKSKQVVVVGTSGALAMNRSDLGLIIIERESSGAYRTRSLPSFDITFLARSLGKEDGAKVISGDIFLKTESIGKALSAGAEPKKSLKIADLRNEDGKFQIISDELKKRLKDGLNSGEKSFFYASKRGSGTVLCMDCGQGVLCKKCGAPVVLYEKNFNCHACGEKRSAREKCTKCDSWNLKEYGVGSEKVESSLKEIYKDKVIVRIDSDSAPTEKKLNELRKIWKEKGNILVGTAKALPYVNDIDLTVVSSLESMLSFPGFNMEENTLRTILLLEEKSDELFIQTHDEKHPLFEILKEKNWQNFHNKELERRKKFSYPPFKILVKISKETTGKVIPDNMQKLLDMVSEHSPVVFFSEPSRTRSSYVAHILLKVSPEDWMGGELNRLLFPLTQTFKIEINPLSLF
jgi:primosomal protein N' (replication factor Y)